MALSKDPMSVRAATQRERLDAPPTGVARRRAWLDRAARRAVTGGGLAVIASIVAILAFLLVQVAPLFGGSRMAVSASGPAEGFAAKAMVIEPSLSHVASLGRDGVLRVHDLHGLERVVERELPADVPLPLTGVAATEDDVLAGATSDGRVVMMAIAWTTTYEGESRRTTPTLLDPVVVVVDPESRPVGALSVRRTGNDSTVAAALADGGIAVVRRAETKQFLTGAVTIREERRTLHAPATPELLLLDRTQQRLYAALEGARIAWWELGDATAEPGQVAVLGGARISALSLLVGDRAFVVGQRDGSLGVWIADKDPSHVTAGQTLKRIHAFPSHDTAIEHVVSSRRNRTFLALDASGGLGLYYSTSERVLWRGRTPIEGPAAIAFAPKGDAAVVAGDGRLALLDVHNPHPEASTNALFGRVWYEGYDGPAFVWQSSSGSDDFEPKLSLVPLLVGTLKGTLYSLILAVPLAILGAMYTSQFMHPRLQRIVKPMVELMASLPSVVLGFLAGLWLAPRIEQSFPGLVLLLIGAPLLALLAGVLWNALPKRISARFFPGTEVALIALVLMIGGAALVGAGELLERTMLDGSFSTWLYGISEARYDQRNAIVVGLAMGFAVIPIIFSISEDAFSNVPPALTAGSLALGASRWQTVVRVVLPTASPGIFSGVMVGFGRAIGETMIVLMATGNTPILDWSPFNGFRTLSANIAVEIPEAPVGGTLYRTLFLAALLLFTFTFVINTAAEIVRQRLRSRFSRL